MQVQKAVWILNQLSGFGIQKFKTLVEKLGDVTTLFLPQTLDELRGSEGWGPEFVSNFQSVLTSGDFERESDRCAQEGVRILSLLDPEYPKNLSSIYDPPLILYVKGTFIPEDEVAIAIVGSRHATTYGAQVSNRFASELAERGVTIVSGFARGIDGEAHRGALRAKGRTIGVLGCGLNVVYPKEHTSLYEQILASGALMSEFPLDTPPQAFNFPRRNRIISGLTMGVLVVEASLRSGSLITARLATEEGREVYAIPGLINSITSGGTNQLIQKGAKLVTCVEDILEDLSPQIRASLNSLGGGTTRELSLHERPITAEVNQEDVQDPILKLLTNQPLSFDEIAVGLGENPIEIRSHLTQLELKGVVKRAFGGRYIRG